MKSVTYEGTSFNADWMVAIGPEGFVKALLDNPFVFPKLPAADKEKALRDCFTAITGISAAPPVKVEPDQIENKEPE